MCDLSMVNVVARGVRAGEGLMLGRERLCNNDSLDKVGKVRAFRQPNSTLS